MKHLAFFSAALICCLFLPHTSLADMSVEIETKVDQMDTNYRTEQRQFTLTLTNAEGQNSERKLLYLALEDESKRDQTILRFVYPPEVKGVSLLTHEMGLEDDLQWLFLPAINRTKRIASSNKSASFMGSEFSYEDLASRQIEKYKFKYLGEEVTDGVACHIIESVPKDPDSGYSRIVRWRDKSNLQEIQAKFYDRKGELLKVRHVSGYHKNNGYWRSQRIYVENVQTGKSSTLELTDGKIGVPLSVRDFRPQTFGLARR